MASAKQQSFSVRCARFAEQNSPMCRLRPGESCSFNTEWFPTRAGSEFHGVSEAGIVLRPLRAIRGANGKVKLSGSFGVLFPGQLTAHSYDEHGASLGTTSVLDVTPTEAAALETEISPQGKAGRVSLHLIDSSGLDRGALGEVLVENGENPK